MVKRKRIFGWQTDLSTCHLYRTQFPFEELAKQGWQVAWGAPGDDIWTYDVIVGQRITGDNELWAQLSQKFQGLLVYDLDDDLIDVDPRNTVPYQIYAPQRDATIRNILRADVVTVSTPTLADKIEKINSEVRVLPNCAHPSWLRPAMPNGPTYGWAGSPFHHMDFPEKLIVELARFRVRHPQIRYHTIGGHYLPADRQTPYQTLESAFNYYDFWVGLAPLIQCEFNESKSWCKALEYACKGIPLVASDVGQYPQWLGDSDAGLLVRAHQKWDEVLEQTLDADWRQRAAEAAYAKASEWTIDNKVHLWAAVYNEE